MKAIRSTALFHFTAVTFLCMSCAEQKNETMVIFAAASLGDVVAELVDSFSTHTEVNVNINLASSGALARQITQGTVPDIYISASRQWMEHVESSGLLHKGTVKEIAYNSLVLIAPRGSAIRPVVMDSTMQLAAMLGQWRLSMGDPAHVPAGRYAQEALEYFGWHSDIALRMLPAKDVRSALMVVEMGESPLGIVYGTDAQKSEKVKILWTFPPQAHQPIAYVAAMCRDSEIGRMFLSYINDESTDSVWLKYGFVKSH